MGDAIYNPLIIAAIFNVVFLAIPPFQDRNGRLSKVLASLPLLKAGYSYIAYSSLESIIEKNKEAYYLALQRAQKILDLGMANWVPWLNFFLISLKRQEDHLKAKTDVLQQNASLPIESILIMQHVDLHHRITIAEAQKLCPNVSAQTIKNSVADHVSPKLLEMHGKARGAW